MIVENRLPIHGIEGDFLRALKEGPVVVTSPTGSGKSTQVPRWCAGLGRVLVIEPRRVACRGLAQWVAQLEGTALGGAVGYAVRDDRCHKADTRIVFATPGVVLRWLADGQALPFDIAIIDEFHERSLDVDLLLGLLVGRLGERLVVMSATMAAERIADHLRGAVVAAEGRQFPVTEEYLPLGALLPDGRSLEDRVAKALERVRDTDGNVLVFLPGKGEIARTAARLAGEREFEVLQIHGGLTLKEQSRVFDSHSRRRVILATNVAETSVTLPGVTAVIDTGLVRRTRYVDGRGHLTLVPIARDSAAQRAGRAGRLSPGRCVRLWSEEAVLEPVTPPEIFREDLAQMLLAALACGEDLESLPLLDPPKPHALDAAKASLAALGAVDDEHRITPRGRRLFGFPLDAHLGSLLIEAEKAGCIEDAIDLVSVLSVGRPLFASDRRPQDPEDDLRIDGCDGVSHIRALREGVPKRHGVSPFVLGEARRIQRRLRKAWSLPPAPEGPHPVDRKALTRAAIRANTRSAYVARRRRGKLFFANGGTEIGLARESAVDEAKVDAVAVVASMAVGRSLMDSRIYATCALPVPLRRLAEAGLGEETVAHSGVEGGVVVARITRRLAGKVLEEREAVPKGALAREAVKALFLEGRLFRQTLEKTRETLEAVTLAKRLSAARSMGVELDLGEWGAVTPMPTLDDWVEGRIRTLGVESGEDLALLSAADFEAPDLPEETRARLDRELPRTLSLGDVTYDIEYDFKKREATLVMVAGRRKTPPPLTTLPALRGFRVRARHHSKVWVLRER